MNLKYLCWTFLSKSNQIGFLYIDIVFYLIFWIQEMRNTDLLQYVDSIEEQNDLIFEIIINKEKNEDRKNVIYDNYKDG